MTYDSLSFFFNRSHGILCPAKSIQTMASYEDGGSPTPDDNHTNPANEADDAQGLPESEDADIMVQDPNAYPDLEEELGGLIVEVLDYANGQMELLVMYVNSTPATLEL